jgi:hypothetical protein
MNTTIQISQETKELISSFGTKSDTYEDIIKRLYKLACEEQLRKFMEPSEKYISIDEAIDLAKRKWQK